MKFKDLDVGDIYVVGSLSNTYSIKTETLNNGWLQSNSITLCSDDKNIDVHKGKLCGTAEDAEVQKISVEEFLIRLQ